MKVSIHNNRKVQVLKLAEIDERGEVEGKLSNCTTYIFLTVPHITTTITGARCHNSYTFFLAYADETEKLRVKPTADKDKEPFTVDNRSLWFMVDISDATPEMVARAEAKGDVIIVEVKYKQDQVGVKFTIEKDEYFVEVKFLKMIEAVDEHTSTYCTNAAKTTFKMLVSSILLNNDLLLTVNNVQKTKYNYITYRYRVDRVPYRGKEVDRYLYDISTEQITLLDEVGEVEVAQLVPIVV